ncbi:hypothetical protein [Paenibacillus thalictri]|uniref:DUF3995 domain-containing protein n=1 Tax=Paenibacillus thalictri TaxID=2527873 RepID=A0A4V2J353_9BACL|nr:hypothetical protein [Paenibacillus thalictri]TBL69832.1 hypothetical protein EYB31_35275 [Paenibacillus thalictri]
MWNAWSLDRVIFLFVGLAFLVIGVQVTISHYRQNFHHKAMWGPVLSAPFLCAVSVWLAFYPASWLLITFMVLMYVAVLEGFVGFYYHFHGVGLRVGGYTSRNFLVGPPVVLPLLYTAMGVLGLLAYYWR